MTEQRRLQVRQAIEARRGEIAALTQQFMAMPELGFREHNTAALVKRTYDSLGIGYQGDLAMTGVKAVLRGGAGAGPSVAIIGELDALPVPAHPEVDPATGAAHACGHNAQTAMVLAAAMALRDSGAMEDLSGSVALLHTPAEELVDLDYRLALRKQGKIRFLLGKPELIQLGHFDDVDMAMLVHNSGSVATSRMAVGTTKNGCLLKTITFRGRAAQAGAHPHLGINALNAAQLAFAGIQAQHETFRDQDSVRVHWIITRGGTAVNVVPAEVQVEMYVRARTAEVLTEVNHKVDRALRAGAMALGATVTIHTLPGYLPLLPYPALDEVFRRSAEQVVGQDGVGLMGHLGACSDLGDLSYIMPCIHPYTGGGKGNVHGSGWQAGGVDDAVLRPACAMAIAAIDLLREDAKVARRELERSKPPMTRQQYLDYMQGVERTEEYDPEPQRR